MGGSRVILWVAIVLVAAFFLYLVRGILFPFVFGLVAAALLDPSIRFLRKKGLSRGLAVTSMLILFFAGLVGAGLLIAPRIAGQFGSVQTNVTNLVQTELFPETKVERFLEDPGALSIRDELSEPYPIDHSKFGEWIRNPNAPDDSFVEFFDAEEAQLAEHDLPT